MSLTSVPRGASPSLNPFHAGRLHGHDELILVVDDESSIREITQDTLEIFGYRTITARNGAEAAAIYALQPQEFALVLTDIMMPVMDGEALILVLQRINAAVRIIAVSGLQVFGNIAKAGVTDFLFKPYTAETLLQLIREVLDRPTAHPAAA